MAVVAEVVEGWTSRLTFQLEEDGVDLVGTGLTLSALDIVGSDGTAVTTTSDFGWLSQAGGTVYYDPDGTDLRADNSPYRIRYQLTDGSGKVAWHPNGRADEIVVHARGV